MEAAVKIENRQQFLVMLTIAAVALFVGVNFILEPLGGWWSSRQAQIKQLRDRVHDGQLLINRETGLRDQWDTMRNNSLPANTSLAEQQLLKAVDEWSRGSGAEVTSLMPQWKNESTNYLTLACRVETAGDLGTLSRFLYNLEKGPMALRLDSVELSAHDKDGLQMTMSAEINGLALTLPDKK
jgi:Tfp pilus assembly protein PilO